ncbi:tRNA (adenosine(37)-N6)-threonylcarbamoyltransferase complex ATPase subunit type 1 TsaE [Solimonas soli]|uniref:tRNA (adenosine(37)-N6)-threonylcarbamoyltransferase complex ATPase subunit type 1 TsaE n=1 Tax=Solimonas soli TaxID=413479 RepID=UPI0004B95C1B|nr:tRNA (adenosine(37)-N6)-threonylcarbamoyltransferase complex ATPase subunit type 1 TsaE [Solimonas soli]
MSLTTMSAEAGQEIALADAEATERLGAALAQWLRARAGAVLFLRGDLGAGKTTLARGLLRALGVTGAIRSPTYTLIEPYELADRHVVHMDLYRLRDPEELAALGVRDYDPRQHVWIVEWPEHGAGFLPPPSLEIELRLAAPGRLAHLRPAVLSGSQSQL